MTYAVRQHDASQIRGALLVVLLHQDEALPKSLKGAAFESARSAISLKDFKGKANETLLTYSKDKSPERLFLIGLGEKKSLSLETLRGVAAIAENKAEALEVDRYVFLIPELKGYGDGQLGEALAEGITLASWSYRISSREPSKKAKIPKVEFRVKGDRAAFQSGVTHGFHSAEGTNLARELAISPANVVTPSHLVRVARGLARRFTSMNCRVLGKTELEKLQMGGILGVNQGSTKEKPYLISLDYHPPGARKTVCIVGKGVTFDTGGISIKPSKGMEEMKFDMCGAAAVMGTMQALGNLRPKIRVVGLIPTTDNMPGGSAIKPGDVIRMYGGLTVEVKNTDAEGRLILGDALEYAKRFKPDATVDLATLTGAVIVALGHELSGLMSNDDDLAASLFDAGELSGERVWRLPLYDVYEKQLSSQVADLSNIGNNGAGTITAASFLSKFAEGMKWAHLDIAGTAWGGAPKEYIKKGPSGVGVRLLLKWIDRL